MIRMRLPLPTRAFLLFAAGTAALLISPPASANGAQSFFSSLDGDFRGRGKAVPTGAKSPVSISCRISTDYQKDTKTFKVSGDCASTQGKTKVSGSLKHNGDKVSGSFISPFADMELTSSNGRVSGGKLAVTSNFVVSSTGELRRLRQIMVPTSKGFRAEFQSYDNATKKFEPVGSVNFSRKK